MSRSLLYHWRSKGQPISQVGWCWWGQDWNSGSDSLDCCLGGNQLWGIGFTNQSSSSKEIEAGGELVNIYLLCWCQSCISLLCPVSGWSHQISGWRGGKSVLHIWWRTSRTIKAKRSLRSLERHRRKPRFLVYCWISIIKIRNITMRNWYGDIESWLGSGVCGQESLFKGGSSLLSSIVESWFFIGIGAGLSSWCLE